LFSRTAAQADHALALLGRRHGQRLVQRVGRLLDVVRVDQQRLGQLARRAGEPAQDQHALLVVARRDELLAHQVHAVVQAGDHAHVGRAVQARSRPRARGGWPAAGWARRPRGRSGG
jgi:transcriptional regulator GlxA family with amidase domain